MSQAAANGGTHRPAASSLPDMPSRLSVVPRKWTEDEEQIMREHFPHTTQAQMLALLPGRTKSTIKAKARDMRLRKTAEAIVSCNRENCRGKDLWDDEEVALLRRLWTTAPIEEVYAAFAPRRVKRGVARKAETLKLKRPRVEVVRQLSLAGTKGAAIARAKKVARLGIKEVQAEQALALQRVFAPAANCAPINLSMVMANPLEAAWRGLA